MRWCAGIGGVGVGTGFRKRRIIIIAAALSSTFWVRAASAGFVTAVVGAQTTDVTNPTSVTSLPYVTPVTANEAGVASAESDPDLTGPVNTLSFTGIIDSTNGTAGSALDYTFTADPGSTYSLFGSATVTTGNEALTGKLTDQTTSATLYSETARINDSGAITPSNIGSTGSLTGSLTAGDTYLFQLDSFLTIEDPLTFSSIKLAAVSSIASVTGSGGLTVATPEPATGALLLVAGLALLSSRRRFLGADPR